jgi:hypothetical protein
LVIEVKGLWMVHGSQKMNPRRTAPGGSVRNLALVVIAGTGLALAGCHAQSQTGGTCAADTDCATPLRCATNYPSGYCSQDCTGNGICAAGSACINVGSATTSECYVTCVTNGNCRALYTCAPIVGLPGGATGVCLPQ